MLVMERNIRRRLMPHENVHHINGIKTDNRLENLELTTFSEHTREHNLGNVFSKQRKENIRNGIAAAKSIKTSKEVFQSIRLEYASGGVTQNEIAQKYGISTSAVYRAIHRKAWE